MKRRRSRLVWSDVAKDWVPRWGARSAHERQEAAHASVGVVEIPGTSVYLGRLGRARGIKKLGRRVKDELLRKAVSKETTSSGKSVSMSGPAGEQRRQEAQSLVSPFASRKLRTVKQKLREVRRQLEAQAKGKRLPPGVLPVLGKSGGGKGHTTSKRKISTEKKHHRGQSKGELKEVLGRAQVSTASFGTYDRLAKNEIKTQKASSRGVSKSLTEERAAYLQQLKRVLHTKSQSTV